MSDVFIIVWSGGYDAPQYEVRSTDVAAWAVAFSWASDMSEGDTIDVLRLNMDTLTIERLGVPEEV